MSEDSSKKSHLNPILLNNKTSKGKKNRHILYALIIILVIFGSLSLILISYGAIKTYIDNLGPSCEEYPSIETVRETVEEHQDVITSIENTSLGYVWVEINEPCDGKGELFIYYDTITTRNKIKNIIGGDTFFGVPYRMFNV